MIILKQFFLSLLFFIGNCIVGMILLAIFKRKKIDSDQMENNFAKMFLAGTGFLFLIFSILAFFLIYKEKNFAILFKYYLIVYACTLGISIVLLFAVKPLRDFLWKQLCVLKTKAYWKEQCLWLLLFLAIALTVFIHKPYLENNYNLPERMSTLAYEGVFGGVNPLNGQQSAVESATKQWKAGVMPAWYLFFSCLFGMPVYRMLFQVVPLWTLGLSMSVYYLIGQSLFEKRKKAVLYFMIFLTLFTLCGNGAYMNPSYGLLHYGYEESTVISSVLLPGVFFLILEWIKKLFNNK